MSLYYPPLDDESTRQILKLNLDMIKERFVDKDSKLKIDEVEIAFAVDKHWRENDEARWNGRQIRNACQTALALAEFDAEPEGHEYDLDTAASDEEVHLQARHFSTVFMAYLDFIKYLKDLHGTDADTYAKESGLRAGCKSSIASAGTYTQGPIQRHDPLHSFRLSGRRSSASQQVPQTRQAGHALNAQHQQHQQHQHQCRESSYAQPQYSYHGMYTSGGRYPHPPAFPSGAGISHQSSYPYSPNPGFQDPEFGARMPLPGHEIGGPRLSLSSVGTSQNYEQQCPEDISPAQGHNSFSR